MDLNILIHGVPDDAFFSSLIILGKQHSLKFYITEGRPLLDGIHVVSKKFASMGYRVTVITDNMIACLMMEDLFHGAIIFYYEKGDKHLICQIGSAIVAICAKTFSIPVYYHPAADKVITGYGDPKALILFDGIQIAPAGIGTYVPLVENVPLSDLRCGYAEAFASEKSRALNIHS